MNGYGRTNFSSGASNIKFQSSFGSKNGVSGHAGAAQTRKQASTGATVPLTLNQISNMQQNQEAQIIRAKLNAGKSFNIEDDLEFCPSVGFDFRNKQPAGRMMGGSLSPYQTPTKAFQPQQAVQYSSQQRFYPSQVSQQQIYTSPQGIRRVEFSNNINNGINNAGNSSNNSYSNYSGNNTHNW